MIKFKIKRGQFVFSILLLAHMPGIVCLVEGRICYSENLVLVSGHFLSARMEHLNRVKEKAVPGFYPICFIFRKAKRIFTRKQKFDEEQREKFCFIETAVANNTYAWRMY